MGFANTAHALPEVVVLFDRSGSMSDGSSDTTNCSGLSKARCGLNFLSNISAGTLGMLNSQYSFGQINYYYWEFRTRTGDADIISNGPTNNPSSEAATRRDMLGADGINNLIQQTAIPRLATDPPDNITDHTPLAQAYCRAVNFLRAKNQPTEDRYIILVSDGFQNPIGLTAADCQGPNSPNAFQAPPYHITCNAMQFFVTNTTAPTSGLLAGGWMSNMLDVALSGTVHFPTNDTTCPTIPTALQTLGTPGGAFTAPSANNAPVILITNFLETFQGLAQFASLAGGDSVPSRNGNLQAAALASPPATGDPFIDFLGGFSQVSNGRLTIPGRPVGDPFALPVQGGDANNNGCVDNADVALVQQFFGQKADFTIPQSLTADVTLDGVINERDYNNVLANYGHGCTAPPPPIQPLAGVLFGFANLGDWSSPDTTLSASSTRSEGTSAIRVAGTNYRNVNSRTFNTSNFTGRVPANATKVAFDVFIPTNPPNPSWLGQVQLFVSCPSASIFNLPLGNFDLTGKPLGKFSTAQFNLPTNVRTAMRASHPDFSIKIAVNSNDPGQTLDNFRVF